MLDDARPYGRVIFQLIRFDNFLEKDLDQIGSWVGRAYVGGACGLVLAGHGSVKKSIEIFILEDKMTIGSYHSGFSQECSKITMPR